MEAGKLQNDAPFLPWQAWQIANPALNGGAAAINARVPRYTRFIENLRLMTLALADLYQNQTMAPHWTQESHDFAGRFTHLLKYYRGVFGSFCTWMQAQAGTYAQQRPVSQIWANYCQTLFAFNLTLSSLPVPWRAVGNIVDNAALQQGIPAEAPLELVVQVFLSVYDRKNDSNTPGTLANPDLVQNTLRTQLANVNNFPPGRAGQFADGFSQCVFVTQLPVVPGAAPTPRVLVAGSTTQMMANIGQNLITNAFTELRQTRFSFQGRTYENDLRGRFNDNNTPESSPSGRYNAVHWVRGVHGAQQAEFVEAVTDNLRQAFLNMVPPVVWQPFNYPNQSARSNFAPKVYDAQEHWFDATPRCLKCRIIHNFTIENEDMHVAATPNASLQCAEDIVFGKLSELGLVQ